MNEQIVLSCETVGPARRAAHAVPNAACRRRRQHDERDWQGRIVARHGLVHVALARDKVQRSTAATRNGGTHAMSVHYLSAQSRQCLPLPFFSPHRRELQHRPPSSHSQIAASAAGRAEISLTVSLSLARASRLRDRACSRAAHELPLTLAPRRRWQLPTPSVNYDRASNGGVGIHYVDADNDQLVSKTEFARWFWRRQGRCPNNHEWTGVPPRGR